MRSSTLFSKMRFSSQNFSVSCSRSTKLRFVETSLYKLMPNTLSLLCGIGRKQKSLRPGQTGRKPGFRYTTHSVSNNTRPGNGGQAGGTYWEKTPLGPRLGRDAAAPVCAGLHQPPALCSRRDAPPVSVMAFALIFRPPFYHKGRGKSRKCGQKARAPARAERCIFHKKSS